MHARNTIRTQVANIIGSGVSTANVYTSRVYPLEKTDLPAIIVGHSGESLKEFASNIHEIRELDLSIDIYCKAVNSVHDELDDISSEIETALQADPQLELQIEDSYFLSFNVELVDVEEQPLAIGNMEWRCIYAIDRTDPNTII